MHIDLLFEGMSVGFSYWYRHWYCLCQCRTVISQMIYMTPPLGLILGGTDFVNLTISMKNFIYKSRPPVVIRYGKFIQTIISLILVLLALFFIIKGINKLNRMASRKKPNEEIIPLQTTDQLKVLCEIRDLLAKQSPPAQ